MLIREIYLCYLPDPQEKHHYERLWKILRRYSVVLYHDGKVLFDAPA